MKRNKSRLKILIALLVLLISSTLIYTTMSYANETDMQFNYSSELNPKYIEWQQLSDEEKANIIMPSPIAITLKDSIKRSTYNSLATLTLSSDSVDSDYDLREKLTEIIVKNQQQTGDCWAFSGSSMIETTLAKKYDLYEEISPMHIEYYVNKNLNKSIGDGANPLIVNAYLAGGKGPAYESDLPFSSVYDEINNSATNFYLKDSSEVELTQEVRARMTESTLFASIYKTYDETTNVITYTDDYGNEYTETDVQGFRQLIKQHIKNYGGVVAGYHAPESTEEINSFYNAETGAYYCNDSDLYANHQITIIGWDDNYNSSDEQKFNSNNIPVSNGAWIILNSWGAEVGENGYMYISYDDCHIENMIMGINDIYTISEETPLEYDNLYEYDPLGMSTALTCTDTSGYLANVFSREDTTKDEYLNSVGISLINTEGIEVYINANGDDFTNLTKVATYTGANALTSGYHTIDITPTQLTGTKFVVAVKYIYEEGAVLPIECNYKETYGEIYSNYWDTATANPGESFISFDGEEWEDLDNLQVSLIDYLKETNACIKAFTTEQEPAPETIAVTGVTLDKTQETLEIDETLQLTATITPEDSTNKNVIWSSSDSNIATVSESGVVTAVAAGTATITVTTVDGEHTATCIVTVQNPTIPVTGVNVFWTAAILEINDTLDLQITVTPEDATNKNVTCSSSDTNIATVSESGVVTAVAAGKATITVTTVDGGYTATSRIIVQEPEVEDEKVPVTGVSLGNIGVGVEVGKTVGLIPTISPSDATNKNVTWSSSDESVATVSGGVVTGVSEGTATITVTTVDGGYTATCEITVVEPIVAVTAVTLNKTTATVKEGKTVQLIPTVTPTDASNKNVEWSSSDESVATVSGGVVTGVSAGTATITVTTVDGAKKASCTITVEDEPTIIPVTSISLNVDELELQVGNQATLVVTLKPTNATNKNVIWSSTDEDVVEVNSMGIITAKKEGIAVVSVTTEDGKYIASASIKVTEKTNTDDDIYTDPDDGKEDDGKDDTVTPGVLPETGEKLLIVGLILIVLSIGTVSVIKFKKYNLK